MKRSINSTLNTYSHRLRSEQTPAEYKLWNRLRRKDLAGYKFKRQVIIGQYIVDFSCFEKKLIIEVDGGHHSEQEEYDKVRTEFLEAEGYRVMRFWNNDVMNNMDSVLDDIEEALKAE